MRRVLRGIAGGLFAVVLATPFNSAQEPVWELSFVVPSGHFVLMEPIWTRVTLTNVSGGQVPRASVSGELYLDGAATPCRPGSIEVIDTVPAGEGTGTPDTPNASPDFTVTVWMNLLSECNMAARGHDVVGQHTVCYRDETRADLRPYEECVSFLIEMPKGVDLEAYDTFGGDPLGGLQSHTGYSELLRSFPSSTYAAYVIWTKYAKGWAEAETERTVQALAEPYPFRTELAPCNERGTPRGGSESRLNPTTFFRCQDEWMDLVLTYHPSIWFGAEMRLRMSLNSYRLGDKEGCAAGLEDLAEHGQPYVAAKAAELLTAMRAAGMLEENTK